MRDYCQPERSNRDYGRHAGEVVSTAEGWIVGIVDREVVGDEVRVDCLVVIGMHSGMESDGMNSETEIEEEE